ncbi:MAG: zf-HC2 domain-containing protein [Candidatus Velthaea sp.]
MNCSSSEALFERFLDGELVPRDRARLLAHVDACAACRGVLEELRVVDALLLTPRDVKLAPNFTFATMAEVRALPQPRPHRAPVLAYLVCYLTATWLLIAAAFVLAPQTMHALGTTLLDAAASVANAFGGVGRVAARLVDRDGTGVGALLGALLFLDVTLAAMFGAALVYVRPRVLERLRS